MLEKVHLFSNLPHEHLAQLEQHTIKRQYAKNTVLFLEGDESTHLYIIESGTVSVFTDDEEGKQLILNYMHAGDYFGELALIDHMPRSASVMTVSPCSIIAISRDNFMLFLQKNPDLHHSLMIKLVDKIRNLTGNVKKMALMDVYGRVAHTLERLSAEHADNKLPKLTHQEIANMVGASREMVSRIMKELVLGDYIELSQKHITIVKPFPKAW